MYCTIKLASMSIGSIITIIVNIIDYTLKLGPPSRAVQLQDFWQNESLCRRDSYTWSSCVSETSYPFPRVASYLSSFSFYACWSHERPAWGGGVWKFSGQCCSAVVCCCGSDEGCPFFWFLSWCAAVAAVGAAAGRQGSARRLSWFSDERKKNNQSKSKSIT